MARLLIKTYKNNNDTSAAYGKTYGRLVHQDTMNTTDLCRHMMKHGTIFTSDVVKGVVERFIMCFEELQEAGGKKQEICFKASEARGKRQEARDMLQVQVVQYMITASQFYSPSSLYYFKDGSNTPTIYQDHPLNFNLSFGLRFNLK